MQVAVFTKNRSNPAYEAARVGADRVAARLGASARHYVPVQDDHAGEQAALLRQALAEGMDALVIAAVHPQAVNEPLAEVHAAGVPIFGFVNAPGAAPCVSVVGADDAALAARIATHLFTAMAEVGPQRRVVLVEGSAESVTARARSEAFLATAMSTPGVQVVARMNGRYARTHAAQAFTQWLHEGLPFDGVLAANDIMAIGVLDAMAAAGRPTQGLMLAGVNAIPQAIEAIQRGQMLASADFNAMAMCALATECALRHARGQTVPHTLMLPVELVTRDNAQRWAKPYAERHLPTLEELM